MRIKPFIALSALLCGLIGMPVAGATEDQVVIDFEQFEPLDFIHNFGEYNMLLSSQHVDETYVQFDPNPLYSGTGPDSTGNFLRAYPSLTDDIIIQFFDPHDPNAILTTDYFGALFLDRSGGINAKSGIKAYDSLGNLIAESFPENTIPKEFISVSAPGINRIILDADLSGNGFDNFTFNQLTVVPEPLSASLMGLGGVLLIGRQRLRKRKRA